MTDIYDVEVLLILTLIPLLLCALYTALQGTPDDGGSSASMERREIRK